ncbi:MAG: T9SS type A sorting domain-containing protein [Bacteroidia bacterium]
MNQERQYMPRFISLFIVLIFSQFPLSGQVGQVQIIHNSPDPELETLDLYFEGALVIDDFNFRSATQYQTVLAGIDVNFGVAPANSSSINDTIRNFVLHFEDGELYNIFIGGVWNTDSFDVNPAGKGIDFNIFLNTEAREAALDSSKVEFMFYNGVTDAPPLDITGTSGIVFGNQLAYGERTGYFSSEPEPLIFNIAPESGNYEINFLGYRGETAIIFTSGFMNPENNRQGESFAVFAAFSDGSVVQLQEPVSARIQFFNAAPDPSLDSLDVYVQGRLYFEGFSYLSATPFLTFPGDSDLTVDLTVPGSQTVIYTRDILLDSGETYFAVITGLLPPNDTVSNPEGKSTHIQLALEKGLKETGDTISEFEFQTYNAIPDAPAARVIADDQLAITGPLGYRQFDGYFSIPAETHTFQLVDSPLVLSSFSGDFTALSGHVGVVLFSGMFHEAYDVPTTMNIILADGEVINYSPTGINSNPGVSLKFSTYPNPFREGFTVEWPHSSKPLELTIINASGQILKQVRPPFSENRIFLDLSSEKAGFYFLRFREGDQTGYSKVFKIE